ncbi:tyrosine-type recombinase/integrase, partial [Tautonia marina]|uniref:tyrosine-type recombinase/integrase n=1 Tax=Tautonia marina TaxID=2653855 RepID=UPI001260BDDA
MARKAKPWFRSDRGCWFVYHQGKQINLGKDEKSAWEKFHSLTGTKPPIASDLPLERPRDIDALVDICLAYYKATRSNNSWTVAKARLSKFRKRFGTYAPEKLTPGQLERWSREQGWSSSGSRGVLTVVNAFLNWCEREKLIAENPVAGVHKPSMERRTLLLTDDQVKRLLEVAPDDLKIMMQLLDSTVARPHLLCTMQASHIDWNNGIAKMRSKGKQYLLYLPKCWLDYLRVMARRFPDGPLLRTQRGKPWTPNGLRQR